MSDGAGERRIAVRRRGNRLGFWFFRVALRATGLRGAYGLLYLVCAWYALADRAAVRAADAYLRRRFPGRGPMRRRWDAYLLFVSQGRTLVDRHAAAAGARGFSLDASAVGALRPLLADPSRGILLVLAHAGSWQFALPELRKLGRPVCLLMRPEDNPAVRENLRLDGADAGFRVVSPEQFLGGVVELIALLRQGYVVAAMGDRSYGYSPVPVRFLGDRAAFPAGPYSLAAAAGCPAAAFLVPRVGFARYRIEVPRVIEVPPAAGPGAARRAAFAAAAQQFADALGEFVGRHPDQCFLFHDVWQDAATLGPP